MIEESFQGFPLFYDPEIDKIEWSGVKIKQPLGKYILPDELKEIQETEIKRRKDLGQVIFNGKCIGMKTDVSEEIELQESDFFSSLATHEAYMAYPEQLENYFLNADGILPITGNGLPNTIGFSSLLICSDGKVPLHQIGSGNSVESNSVGVSGAGSANPGYFEGGKNISFEKFITNGMEGEIIEESGLPKDAFVETRITGFARLAHRAGLPQFYGLSFTEATSKDLAKEIDETEKDFVESKFFIDIKDLLKETPDNPSHTLEVTLDRAIKSGLLD